MSAGYAIRCRECEKYFIPTYQNRLYCCVECAKESRRKALNAAKEKYYITHIGKFQKPKRELTCKSCGNTFYGHGNAKYCDNCLKSDDPQMKKLYYQRKAV